MKRLIPAIILLFSYALYSCSGLPSRKEIRNKVLQEFICPANATIEEMKIVSTEESIDYSGDKTLRYTVTGEVAWPGGCSDFGTGLHPGARERFQKTVTLSRDDEGVWH
jgi:hypothetical protein